MEGFVLRLVAACVLAGCCALTGRALAASFVRRARMLEELGRSVSLLKIDMLDRLTPLREALAKTGHPGMKAVAEGMKSGGGAGSAWRAARGELCARGGALDCLNAEDLAEIEQLFDQLGISGVAQQRMVLEGAAAMLDERTADARKKAQEQGKLYTSLGLLCGMALAILLL